MERSASSTNLDLLRACAVACVFLFHLRCTFGGSEWLGSLNLWALGRVGVLLFFVHTSLVLMLSMERMGGTPGQIAWPFYVRRFFRIYPLSVVCVLAAVVLHQPSSPWFAYSPVTLGQIISNLLLVQNVTDHTSILGPLWSLPYEVQMYLLLPWTFLLVARRFRLTTVGALVVLAMVAPLVEMRITGNAHVFHYAPCFLGGIVAFYVLGSKHPRLPAWLWPVMITGSIVLFCVIENSRKDDARFTAAASWVFCLLFGLLVPCFSEIRSRMVNRVSAAVAKYSYGIYLAHGFAMWIAFVRLGALPVLVRRAVFVALAVSSPVVAYHTVEEPLIRAGRRLAARVRPSGNEVPVTFSAARARCAGST